MSNKEEPIKKKSGVNLAKFAKRMESKSQPVTQVSDAVKLTPDTPIVLVDTGAESTLKGNKAEKKSPKASDKRIRNEELKGLQKASTYLVFCDWIAQPEVFRNPRNQKQFAKMHSVSEDTLSEWKQRPTFWVTVEKRLKSHWREKSGSVMQALMKNIMKKGGSKEVVLYYQLMWGVNLRDVAPDPVPDDAPFDASQITQMADAMRNAGLSGVTEHHKKMAEVFNDLSITDKEDDYAEDN